MDFLSPLFDRIYSAVPPTWWPFILAFMAISSVVARRDRRRFRRALDSLDLSRVLIREERVGLLAHTLAPVAAWLRCDAYLTESEILFVMADSFYQITLAPSQSPAREHATWFLPVVTPYEQWGRLVIKATDGTHKVWFRAKVADPHRWVTEIERLRAAHRRRARAQAGGAEPHRNFG